MPIGSPGSPVFVAGVTRPRPMGVNPPPQGGTPARYRVSGTARDSSGVAVAGRNVSVFEYGGSKPLRGVAVSDASGNFSIDVSSAETGLTFFAMMDNGSTLTGVSVVTLTGTSS